MRNEERTYSFEHLDLRTEEFKGGIVEVDFQVGGGGDLFQLRHNRSISDYLAIG